MNFDDARPTFINEGRELIEEMERALLSLQHHPRESDAVNAVFRAAHTIKGSAGLFGLDHVVAFTHVVESVLDEARSGKVVIDESLIATLLASGDHIGALLDVVAAGRAEPEAALTRKAEPLLAQLTRRLRAHGSEITAESGHAPTEIDPGGGDTGLWHISLRFGRSVLCNGMDPLSFIRYLGTIGRIVTLVTLPDALPGPAEMDPECCYLGFEIGFCTQVTQATIENVFEFVVDDCAVRILPPNSKIEAYLGLIHQLPEDPTRLADIFVQCGTVSARQLADALQSPATDVAMHHTDFVSDKHGGVRHEPANTADAKPQHGLGAKAKECPSVRVDADKIDHLINLVGELIIASTSATLAARSTQNGELHEAHSTLSGLVEELRDSALKLRMVKIGATFHRFERVVHDVSRETGKDIKLVVNGEDTELDKTVVEKIADPLTHLVRNAIDHGIESTALRAERGKSARGTVRLNAYHDSGSVVIEVCDDGGGLDRERILAKAADRGLLEAGRALTDREIYALIFEPGFSTADRITNLSGRGVGMDVVKRNITALRGSVEVDSTAGLGTMVTVRLPLTLAIINGFQVSVGPSVFVVPQEMVDECVEFTCEAGQNYTDLRGAVLPFIRLREQFEIGAPPGSRQNMIVVRVGAHKFGLVVDRLLGESQTVIRPLSKMFNHVKGISGSSIRGNGEVALILDVPALMAHACLSQAPSTEAAQVAPAEMRL